MFWSTDYGRPERKQPSLHGQKFNPNPKFLGMAAAYFVCHICLIFQISLIYAFIGCPQYVLYIIHILYILTFIFKIKSIRSMPTRDLYADWGIFGYNPWVPINNNIIRREQAELRARPQMGGVSKFPIFVKLLWDNRPQLLHYAMQRRQKVNAHGFDLLGMTLGFP